MGMVCHTACNAKRCKNFNECKNNIEYFKQNNTERLDVKVNRYNERGLYAKKSDFQKGEFIAIYNGLVNVYDAPQTSNFVMNISPRYSIDAANPQDSTIPVCLAGFINHGCRSAANAFTRIFNTGFELVVAVYALKTIEKGSEIRFDYAASSPNDRSTILGKLGINKCNCSECYTQTPYRVSKRKHKSIQEKSEHSTTSTGSKCSTPETSKTDTSIRDQELTDKNGSENDWIQISHKKREKQLSRKSGRGSLQLLNPIKRAGLLESPSQPMIRVPEGEIKILSNTKSLKIDSTIYINILKLGSRTNCDQVAAQFPLIFQAMQNLFIPFKVSAAFDPDTKEVCVQLCPKTFNMECRHIKTSSGLLHYYTLKLRETDHIIDEGSIINMAISSSQPNTGDVIYDFLRKSFLFRHKQDHRVESIFPTKEYIEKSVPFIHQTYQPSSSDQAVQSLKKVLKIDSDKLLDRLNQLQKNNQLAMALIQKNQLEIEDLQKIIMEQGKHNPSQVTNTLDQSSKSYTPMVGKGNRENYTEEQEEYYLALENYNVKYTIRKEPHSTRRQVFTIDIPLIKCQSKEGAMKKIESSRNLIDQILQWPSFMNGNNQSVEYIRTIHKYGHGICICDSQITLITSEAECSFEPSIITIVGKAIWLKGECYTVKSFKSFLDHNFKPPAPKVNTVKRNDSSTSTKTRIMIEPDFQSILDIRQLCTPQDLQMIEEIDIQNFGQHKIKTIDSIKRKNVIDYQRIFNSIAFTYTQERTKNIQQSGVLLKLLWLLPAIILRFPQSKVQNRIDHFLNGNLSECMRDMFILKDNYFATAITKTSVYERAAKKVFTGNFSTAVAILTADNYVAPHSRQVQAMIEKHPERSAENSNLIDHMQPIPQKLDTTISQEIVYSVIKNPTRRGKAPGANGQRFEYLHSLTLDPFYSRSDSTTLWLITKMVNLEVNNKLPDWYYKCNGQGLLMVLGEQMRPINMGTIDRKLTSACMITKHTNEITSTLAPYQLGTLSKNGSETVIHFTRLLLEMHNETWASIQIDVKNAFNSASRAHTLTQIAMHIPEMYNYILSMYRLQHKLWMNVPDEQLRTHIIAGEGSPQGAVDGSFFFTLAINYILVKMNGLVKENGGGVFVAISDDVTGKGNPTAIAISVIYMLQQFAKLGLTVNITNLQFTLSTSILSTNY